ARSPAATVASGISTFSGGWGKVSRIGTPWLSQLRLTGNESFLTSPARSPKSGGRRSKGAGVRNQASPAARANTGRASHRLRDGRDGADFHDGCTGNVAEGGETLGPAPTDPTVRKEFSRPVGPPSPMSVAVPPSASLRRARASGSGRWNTGRRA